MNATFVDLLLFAGGLCFGVVLMAILYLSRSGGGNDDDLLGDLEAANLSLSRIEDDGEVFWACSTGTPRVVIGTPSPNPRLAIQSAINDITEQSNG